MQALIGSIVVAVIMGPLIVVMNHKLRNDNTEQHGAAMAKQEENGRKLDSLAVKVDIQGTKLDGHIGWHQGMADSRLEADRSDARELIKTTAQETARVLANG